MSLTQWDGGDDDVVKYAIPNTGLGSSSEWLQYTNRMISLICCMKLHFYIVTRLVLTNKCNKMNDYQMLIVVQSGINILACLFELILNEIQTQNLQIVKIGHPFWKFSLTETAVYTIAMAVTSNSTQDFLMLFNLHRLVLIKRGSLMRMYLMATPLMFIGMGADVKDSFSLVMKGQDINLFYKYGQLPIIIAVIVFCYVKLNREFAINKTISDKTKKLQQKLSASVLIQIIMLAIVSFLVNFIPWIFKKFGDPTFYTQHIVTYVVLSDNMSDEEDIYQIREHQYTVTNYGITDKYEWLQYINRLLSQSMCIWLHVSIVSRLLVVNNFKIKSDYQILIIAQSVINILACIFDVILNEIQTQNNMYVKVGHPFWQFSMMERVVYTICMTTSSTSTQDILMVFNLHRLFIIKKMSLMKLYAVAMPLMLIGPIGDGYVNYQVILAGRDVDLFVKHSQIPVIAIVIIICFHKLKKEFMTNPSFSEKTKRLQQKLGWSILMQLVLLIIISLIIMWIPWVFEIFADKAFLDKYSAYYIIYSLVVTQWYSFCSAALIAWSITGFFKNQSPPTTIQHSDVKIFQVEPAKPGAARKQSTKLSLV